MEVLSEVQQRRLPSVPMPAAPVEERRLVIAIDYGTTYTGQISLVLLVRSCRALFLDQNIFP